MVTPIEIGKLEMVDPVALPTGMSCGAAQQSQLPNAYHWQGISQMLPCSY